MKSNMIEQYFTLHNELHNRIYGIIHALDNFDFQSYSDYVIGDIQQTGCSLIVNMVYAEPYEDYTNKKRFIFPSTLFTEEYPEEKIISFWKDYIEKEEASEVRYSLEQTLLGLNEELLEKLSSLEVDISQLEEYSYRNEILSKLRES